MKKLKKYKENMYFAKVDKNELDFENAKNQFDFAYRSGNFDKLLQAGQEITRLARQRIAIEKRKPKPGKYVDVPHGESLRSVMTHKTLFSKRRATHK